MIHTMPPTEDDMLVLERQRYDARRALSMSGPRKTLGMQDGWQAPDPPTPEELARMVEADRDAAEERKRDWTRLMKLASRPLLEAHDGDPRTWPVADQRAAGIEYTPSGLVRGASYGWGVEY